ncbi:hypothetical protein BX600DRAFT_253285 [Xylariales sp. PMI_506]|nr:hypothetical protein BX600DRAFT_253285 [Xylariales sp. PMI_506]
MDLLVKLCKPADDNFKIEQVLAYGGALTPHVNLRPKWSGIQIAIQLSPGSSIPVCMGCCWCNFPPPNYALVASLFPCCLIRCGPYLTVMSSRLTSFVSFLSSSAKQANSQVTHFDFGRPLFNNALAYCLITLFSKPFNLKLLVIQRPVFFKNTTVKMRFAAAAALFAGAMAQSTVFSTDYITITSCAPEITNCPARSTATYSSVYAVSSASSYPAGNTTAPYPISYPASGYPTTVKTAVASSYPAETYPVSSSPAETYPVSVLTISTTTCVPTVSYSTITVYPTSTAATPSSGSSAPGYNT